MKAFYYFCVPIIHKFGNNSKLNYYVFLMKNYIIILIKNNIK